MDVDDEEIIYHWQRIRDGSMEILIIGNGFDLEHNLPTTYQSFLEFCNRFYYLEKYSKTLMVNWINKFIRKNWGKDKLLQASVIDNFRNYFEYQENDRFFELYKCIQDNVWIQYFEDLKKMKEEIGGDIGENWIDFEMEISKVIQFLDDFRIAMSKIDDDIKRFEQFSTSLGKSIEFRLIWSIGKIKGEKSSILRVEDIDQIVSILDTELERFIRAFEIYIDEIVNKLPIIQKSKDIENINPDFVLSFNYSKTYERVYGEGKDIQYDYIHGKADANKNIKTCNLVLGIDEYLKDDRKDTDLEFIAFKKYFQRIYKSTGNAYLEWVDKIKKDYDEYVEKVSLAKEGKSDLDLSNPWERHIRIDTSSIKYPQYTLYIFGHSLDVTDRDILRLFICNDNVQTKIFYHQKDADDKTTLGKLIKNLVRIMGQDELIRRTGGEHKTIEFRPQSKHEE